MIQATACIVGAKVHKVFGFAKHPRIKTMATASKFYTLIRMAICEILYQSQGW